MPDAIQIEVRGLEQLGRALQSIPAVLSTRVMRGALHAAGDVMAEAAESTAPVRSGELKADIIVKVHVGSDLSNNYVVVGPGYDRGSLTVRGTRPSLRRKGATEAIVDTSESPGVYGKFVELGHQNGHRSGGEIEHGSGETPPHPWLRPAFEISKETALETFVEYTRGGLEGVCEAVRTT